MFRTGHTVVLFYYVMFLWEAQNAVETRVWCYIHLDHIEMLVFSVHL